MTRGGLLNDSPRVGCPSSLTRIVRIKCRARDLLESPKISEISFCGEKQGTGSAHQVIRRETGVPEGPSTLPSDGWLGGTGTLSAPRGPCAGAASASELSKSDEYNLKTWTLKKTGFYEETKESSLLLSTPTCGRHTLFTYCSSLHIVSPSTSNRNQLLHKMISTFP